MFKSKSNFLLQMKKEILFLVFLVFLAGCTIEEGEINQINNDEKDIENFQLTVNMSTDKELYHSNEAMKIIVGIQSSDDLKEAQLRTYGIYAARYRMDQNKIINLTKGDNEIIIDYTTPKCTGCAGIAPGTYQIFAELGYEGIIIGNSTKNIEIRQ